MEIKEERLSSVLRPDGSGREMMDYNSSFNLIAVGRKTEESQKKIISRHLLQPIKPVVWELIHVERFKLVRNS